MTHAVWITRTYPWRDQPAIGVFYQAQARAVVRAGAMVTVACPTPWAPWPLDRLRPKWRAYAAAPRDALDQGVHVLRPRYVNVPGEPSWARPDGAIAGAMWRCRPSWSGARIIHGHYSVTGLAAWRLSRRAGLPFVLTFHGSDINSWPAEHPERAGDLQQAVRDAAAVFTVSRPLADRVEALTGVEATYLPIGSDHRALAAASVPRAVARERLGIPADRVVVLFVGNLKAAKGVRVAADAVIGLGDPYLGVFVGDGPERGYGLDRDGASDRLVYAGPRSPDEVGQYMSAADVLVLPSSSEGLPTVLVEAGSLALPVVASAVGGIPDLLADGRGMLLSEITAEALAGSLRSFVGDREAARARADRLRAFVVSDHDVDRQATRLVEHYDAAIRAHGDGPSVGS